MREGLADVISSHELLTNQILLFCDSITVQFWGCRLVNKIHLLDLSLFCKVRDGLAH